MHDKTIGALEGRRRRKTQGKYFREMTWQTEKKIESIQRYGLKKEKREYLVEKRIV